MKNVDTYQNKKIFVLGLARSGMAAAKLLHSLGAFVTVNDGKPFEENPSAKELLDLGIKVIAGSHPIELLDEDYALMVKNPGIPYNNPMVKKALEKGIPVITEVELAYEVLEGTLVAITGTNGKTTTTTMIGEILNASMTKGKAALAGNIGYPASEVAPTLTKDDVMVTENSSFQLMGITDYKPHIAVVTNVYSAHLDYHGSQEAYEEAKWQIQKNMTENDFLILNDNQEKMHQWAQQTKAQVIFFSTTREIEGAYLKDGILYFKGEAIMAASELGVPGSHNVENALAAITVGKLFNVKNEVMKEDGILYFKGEAIMAASELGVPGSHNVENALAAITVGKLFNVKNEVMKEVLAHFHGVPHRTQYIATINERRFFNDSKATNSLATKRALSGFDNEKTILLAGGLDRGNGFDDLLEDERRFFNDSKATNSLATKRALSGFDNEKTILLAGGLDRGNGFDDLLEDFKNLKAIITFGETKKKLQETAKKAHVKEILEVADVKAAVPLAYEISKPGDTILLSPANASWDQYKSFEQRGEIFVEAVKEIQKDEEK